MEWTYKLADINKVAAEILNYIPATAVVAFHGAMGAGKTSLIHAICDIRKVKDVVGSPTFSIINEYAYEEEGIEKKIFHIDLYRLKNEKEALQAGVEDCLYSEELCLVEWPEKAAGIFPEHTIHFYIDIINQQTRRLQIVNN